MGYPGICGKVAIVTGAASGIGLASARALAAQGANVVLCDRAADELDAALALITGEGGKATVACCDVSSAADWQAAVARTLAWGGRLDLLINNAGIPQVGMKLLCDVEESQFDAILGVNIKGVWLGMKHAIPAMLAGGGGAIVNMSSSAGLVGQAGVSIYAATKHAVLGLTKCAALEYGIEGIRINAVCPGAVDSPIRAHRRAQYSDEEWAARARANHPATGRDGTAEEIAAAVVFLCSDGASNIHGIALPVDGGRVAQ